MTVPIAVAADTMHSSAYIVIICSFLMRVTIVGSDSLLFHTTGLDIILYFSVSQAIAYLLYPLLGWLSDVYFTRYRVIRLAFIIVVVVAMVFTSLSSALMALGISSNSNLVSGPNIIVTLFMPALIVGLLALGLFEANAIQFGMDQMLEASSDQLSTFIHWYYWSNNLGQ